jgi:hypothetical protein
MTDWKGDDLYGEEKLAKQNAYWAPDHCSLLRCVGIRRRQAAGHLNARDYDLERRVPLGWR